MVTTLLLNPVALLLLQGLLNGPWRNPVSGFPDSENFGPGYEMPMLFGSERVHAGFLVAVVAIALTGVVMTFTPLGLRIKAAGQSPDAARFSGIRVGRIRLWSALASGAIAGLAGAVQVLGVQHQVTQSIATGYGYTGIVVATLGGLSAIGVLAVGLLLGDITVGARNASFVLQLPTQMGQLVTALLLLTVVSCVALSRYRLVRRATSSMSISWLAVLGGMLTSPPRSSSVRSARSSANAPVCSTSASRARCTPAPSSASWLPTRAATSGWGSAWRSSPGPPPAR